MIDAPPGSARDRDWSEWYKNCPKWGDTWNSLDIPEHWPPEFKVIDNRLFLNNKECVPTALQHEVIRLGHEVKGHHGFERTWELLSRQYEWADARVAQECTRTINRECHTCQANDRPRNKYGPIAYTPIPPAIMEHVALDIFNMPEVRIEGKRYDCMVVCVCRHSGWIVAVPELLSGLRGDLVAKAMVKNWTVLGIPSKVTSDRGPQFNNAWWKTMCAQFGITQIYSQPYHHQANGRAERAGQQLQEVLRKLYTDSGETWVELLPRAINIIHDAPGESGLSPFHILFGRERNTANLPYQPPTECEDAQDFFKRMNELDQRVAKAVNEIHKRDQARINARRKKFPPLAIGQTVWYRRPEGSGEKLDTRWIGPMEVISREGEDSYLLSSGPGTQTLTANRAYLKEYVFDTFGGIHVPLYFYKRTPRAKPTPVPQMQVKRIIDHKKGQNGELSFCVHHEGEDVLSADYHPVKDFLDENAQKLAQYCREHNLGGTQDILSRV